MDTQGYQAIDKPITIKQGGVGVVAKMGEEGSPVQLYEILLAKKSEIIVRALGPRRSTTPVKITMPNTWTADGHTIDGVKYNFLLKEGAKVSADGEKVKRPGPKRGDGPTKMDICKQIWDANPNLTRADMKAKFCNDPLFAENKLTPCTEQGANTYYLTIKKEKGE